MAIIVEGPGGEEVEFPDDTPHEVMSAAMRKHFGAPAAPAAVDTGDGSGGVGPDYAAIGADKTPLLGFVEALGNGAFANWGDEASAAAGSLPSKITGGRYGKDYQTILDETRARRKQYAEEHPSAARTGEVTGALGMGALTGGLGVGAAPGIVRAIAAPAIAGGVFGGVDAAGRVEGEHTPREYAEEMAPAAATGAVIGGGLGGLGNIAGRVVGPWATQAARYLHERGVRLTPGELIGGGAHRIEDSLSAVPFLGNQLRARRQEGVDTFNRAAWNEALAPLPGRAAGKTIHPDTPMGHDAAVEAEGIFNTHYGRTVPRLVAEADAPFTQEVARLSGQLPQSARPEFADAYRRHIAANMDAQTGRFAGRDIQDSIQGLRKQAQNLRTSRGNAYDMDLADALDGMRDAIQASAQRYSTPRRFNAFERVNRAYRNYVPLRDAGTRLGADAGVAADTPAAGGVFRPAQLLNASRAADKSVAKGEFGRGNAPMQATAQTGKTVMGREVPDSGTPERLAVGALLGGAGYAGGAPAIAPMLGLLGLYSRPGNTAFQALATFSPATRMAIRRAIERASGTVGAGAGAVRNGEE